MNQQSGWQLSGSGPEAYERFISEPITMPCVPGLFEAVELSEGDRVLDVGCGTGIVARMAAERVGPNGRVLGVDLNDSMLSTARRLAEGTNGSKLEWRQADATALPVDEGAFDVAFCQQALQFVPDKAKAALEMYRALAPEGRLGCSVLRDLQYNPYQQAVADALAQHVGPEAAAVIHTPFAFGDPEALRQLAGEAGFHDVHIRLEIGMMRYGALDELVPGYLASTPAASSVADADEDTHQAILQDIEAALAPYLDDDGLAAPIEFYVLTARK